MTTTAVQALMASSRHNRVHPCDVGAAGAPVPSTVPIETGS